MSRSCFSYRLALGVSILIVLSAFAALAWSDRSARLYGSIELLASRARIEIYEATARRS